MKTYIIERIHKALSNADCWFKVKPCSWSPDGTKDLECTTPCIQAVRQHQSGDIWVATGSKAEHKMCTGMIQRWLPKLSDQLSYTHKTYLVLVHGIPTAFDMSCDGQDLTINLISNNANIIMHPLTLQHTEFLTQAHNQSSHKTRA